MQVEWCSSFQWKRFWEQEAKHEVIKINVGTPLFYGEEFHSIMPVRGKKKTFNRKNIAFEQ